MVSPTGEMQSKPVHLLDIESMLQEKAFQGWEMRFPEDIEITLIDSEQLTKDLYGD